MAEGLAEGIDVENDEVVGCAKSEAAGVLIEGDAEDERRFHRIGGLDDDGWRHGGGRGVRPRRRGVGGDAESGTR